MDGTPKTYLNICVQAYPLKTGTIKLSSKWNGGTVFPQIVFGNVNAGVGTIKSAKAPANPNTKDAINIVGLLMASAALAPAPLALPILLLRTG